MAANTADGTDLFYNGITLRNVLTKVFDQQDVYDKTNTDVIYTKFRVSVVTYVSDSQLGSLGADVTSGTTVANQRTVRAKLLEPRGAFKYIVGRQNLLSVIGFADSGGTSVAMKGGISPDANNGPKPIHCAIDHISAAKTFRIEFEIELAVVECQSTISNTKGILSNRWSLTDSYDPNFFGTRTIHGTLRGASATIDLQSFRSLVMPPIGSGYKRTQMDFTVDPDGLSLDYTITDKQIFASAPFPATDWKGTDTIGSNNGAVITRNIGIQLSGPPSVKKSDLLTLAIRMALFKIDIVGTSGARDTARPVLRSFSLVDHLDQNSVEFNMQIQTADKNAWQYITAGQTTLGGDFRGLQVGTGGKPYDPSVSVTPVDVGMAKVANLFACYLQSPCDDNHDINSSKVTVADTKGGYQPAKGDKVTQVNVTIGVGPSSSVQDSRSTDHKKAIYTFYQIENDYFLDNVNVQLPIATQKPPSKDGDTSVVVTLGGGLAKRKIHITAERCGAWPDIPLLNNYQSGTLKGTLLNSKISPFAPTIMVDGSTKMFHLEATIYYALNRLPTTGERLSAGSLPWNNDTVSDDSLPGTVEKPDLI